MGGCCCGQKENKSNPKKGKNDGKTPIGGADLKTKSNETPDKRLLSEDKLKEEEKNAFKAGESDYNKQKKKPQGIDDKAKELQIVKTFLKGKGYDVEKSIGSGNYAEVYKALGKKVNKTVAVKVIDLKKANENYRVNFLQSQINILKIFKHPNIIKMYEICQTKKRIGNDYGVRTERDTHRLTQR